MVAKKNSMACILYLKDIINSPSKNHFFAHRVNSKFEVGISRISVNLKCSDIHVV